MDAIETAVIAVLKRHLSAASSAVLDDPDVSLSAAGLDSLKLVGFILDLEHSLSIRFAPEAMNAENFVSLSAAVRTVAEARALADPHGPPA